MEVLKWLAANADLLSGILIFWGLVHYRKHKPKTRDAVTNVFQFLHHNMVELMAFGLLGIDFSALATKLLATASVGATGGGL